MLQKPPAKAPRGSWSQATAPRLQQQPVARAPRHQKPAHALPSPGCSSDALPLPSSGVGGYVLKDFWLEFVTGDICWLFGHLLPEGLQFIVFPSSLPFPVRCYSSFCLFPFAMSIFAVSWVALGFNAMPEDIDAWPTIRCHMQIYISACPPILSLCVCPCVYRQYVSTFLCHKWAHRRQMLIYLHIFIFTYIYILMRNTHFNTCVTCIHQSNMPMAGTSESNIVANNYIHHLTWQCIW